jgi:hypothetical protein
MAPVTIALPAWLAPMDAPVPGYCVWGTDAEGRVYAGDQNGPFWTEYRYDPKNKAWPYNGHGLRCRCGCETFRLTYGGYELRGTCPACGATDVVYDG